MCRFFSSLAIRASPTRRLRFTIGIARNGNRYDLCSMMYDAGGGRAACYLSDFPMHTYRRSSRVVEIHVHGRKRSKFPSSFRPVSESKGGGEEGASHEIATSAAERYLSRIDRTPSWLSIGDGRGHGFLRIKDFHFADEARHGTARVHFECRAHFPQAYRGTKGRRKERHRLASRRV